MGFNTGKNDPKLSVLMSVYNGASYLGEALDSILDQSFKDFEFIVIDDGSQDNTWEVLSDYAGKDSRLVLHRNKSNLGLTKSLNKGLNLARGEYIARMDADDISLSGRLEAQVNFLDTHPEVGLVSGGSQVIDETGRLIYEKIPPLEDEAIKMELLIKNNAIGHSTIMARTAKIREVGGYNENILYSQDYDLWLRLNVSTKFASLPVPVIKWRVQKKSISNTKRQEQLEYSFRISVRALGAWLKNGELDLEVYERVWWAYHGYFDALRPGDVVLLNPLWDLLASKAELMKKTTRGFRELGYNLLRHGRFRDGFQMLRIAERRLGQHLNRVKILKAVLYPAVNKMHQAIIKNKKPARQS